MRWVPSCAVVATALCSQPALAWGNEGHEIVASIARRNLTPKAKSWVDDLLSQDADTLTAPDMVTRATWADRWRDSGHRETAAWHFVDLELVKPSLKTACFGFPAPADPPSSGPTQDCVADKISEFMTELSNPSTASAEQILALKYLLHFVGDIHQPLHASDNEDRGGNCVAINAGGKTSNLHSFWDTGVLAPLGADPGQAAEKLDEAISAANRKKWAAGTPSQWATESYGVAKAAGYTIGSAVGCPTSKTTITLTTAYQTKALAAAKRQLQRAGIRLAWVLNTAAAKQQH